MKRQIIAAALFCCVSVAAHAANIVSAPPIDRLNAPWPRSADKVDTARPVDVRYLAQARSSLAEGFGAFLSGTIRIESFGAKGDGVTDDTNAFNAAIASTGLSGGLIQLTCGRHYYIAGNVNLYTNPMVELRGCLHTPDNLFPLAGFPGNINTFATIVRAPDATIFLGRGSSLTHMAIVQLGVTDAQEGSGNFAGTAISLPGGGAGSRSNINNVLVVGADLCYDGSNGADRVRFQGFYCDGINGEVIGQSADTSTYDNIQNYPYATFGFSGYPITSIVGDGVKTTIRFSPQKTIPVGNFVSTFGVKSADGSDPFPPAQPMNVVHAVTASSPGEVTFINSFNSSKKPLSATLGVLRNYSSQFYRSGIGLRTINGSDDTHFGTVLEFGHATCAVFQSHGIFNFDHLWCDNNYLMGVELSNTYENHFGSLDIAMNQGTGLQLDGKGSSASIANLQLLTSPTDCIVVQTGSLQVGNARLQNCQKYGINQSAGTHIGIANLDITGSRYGRGNIVSQNPSDIWIGQLTTDLPDGKSAFANTKLPVTLTVNGNFLFLPPSFQAGGTAYDVSGFGTVAVISQGYGSQEITLKTTGTVAFRNSGAASPNANGNICLAGGRAAGPGTRFGGTAGSIIKFIWDNTNSYKNIYGGCWREEWRSTP